ncbi:hypothetical protein V6N11_033389 [Hibiscus sabdariffa]|uniref:Reverse transcriptase zinc-binding domain-containing protein n=1 Tax=Hibiscus sabdariffa TaxID=183260 RepID=A0ABR2PY20_9ROSI
MKDSSGKWESIVQPPCLVHIGVGTRVLFFLSDILIILPNLAITCGDFMIPSYTGWDVARVRDVITPNNAEQILNCPIANRCSDLLVWSNYSSGTYSIRLGYAWLMKPEEYIIPPPKLWNVFAKLKTLPKIQIYIWRIAHEALPVSTRIGKPKSKAKYTWKSLLREPLI